MNNLKDQLEVIECNGKFGLQDKNGKEVIPCIYENIWIEKEYIKLESNGKFGIRDADYEWKLLCEYDSIENWNEFFEVSHCQKYGVLDKDFNIIIPLIYEEVNVYEKYVIAKLDGKYGVLDYNQHIITPLIYDELESSYVENFFITNLGGKKGIIRNENTNSEVIFPPEYDDIEDGHTFILRKGQNFTIFQPQTFKKKSFEYDNVTKTNYGYTTTLDKKYGFINHLFEEIFSPIYEEEINFKGRYQENFIYDNLRAILTLNQKKALAAVDGKVIVPYGKYDDFVIENFLILGKIEDKYNFLDMQGNEILPSEFDDYVSELCHIQLSKNRKQGLLNTKGEVIIPFKFDAIINLEIVHDEGRVGVYKDFKYLIKPIYDEIKIHRPKDEYVVRRNQKWGVFDKNGKQIHDFIYDNIEINFETGLKAQQGGDYFYLYESSALKIKNGLEPLSHGFFKMQSENNLFALLDRNNTVLTAFKYDDIECNRIYTPVFKEENFDKYFYVELNQQYGIIDEHGKELTPIEYSDIRFYNVTKNGLHGKIDKVGKEIVACIYDEIDGNVVNKNGKHGIIDDDGNLIIPCFYDDADTNSKSIFAVKQDKKWGIIDTCNDVLIDFKYDKLTTDNDLLVIATIEGKTGVIDLNENIIVPFEEGKIIFYEDTFIRFIEEYACYRFYNKQGCVVSDEQQIIRACECYYPPLYMI